MRAALFYWSRLFRLFRNGKLACAGEIVFFVYRESTGVLMKLKEERHASRGRVAFEERDQAADMPILEDPTTKYPKPPFHRQSQPWPGLASKMDPRPDHGETSYRGSGRLAGRRALITGGDSGMGRAAAIAYAREGADVVINYLPDEEPDPREVIALIKEEHRVGLALPGDLRDEAFCQRLVAQAVKGLGGLDIVICNAGRQQSHESILDISTEEFDWTMKTNI
jgi:hypothetical protein